MSRARSPKLAAAVLVALLATASTRAAQADPPASAPKQDQQPEGTTTRDVVAYTLVGLGGAALVVGIAETVHATSLSNQGQTDRQQVPASVTDVCSVQTNPSAAAACQANKDSSSAWTAAWIGYGAAAALATTGVVLLLTRPHQPASAGRVDVTPAVSLRSAGIDLRVAF
jgi:hypothetical protein